MCRDFFSFIGKLTLVHVSDSHSTKVNFVSQGIFSKVWRYFGLSQLGRDKELTGNEWVETRDAAKHPTMHRKFPPTRNSLAPMSVVPRLRNPELCCLHR